MPNKVNVFLIIKFCMTKNNIYTTFAVYRYNLYGENRKCDQIG